MADVEMAELIEPSEDRESHVDRDFHGDGAGNPCRKVQVACSMLCVGIFLFPAALFLLGWNERNYICTEKSIIFAEDQATEVPCDSASQNPEGMAMFFSCPLDTSTFKNFTLATFNDRMGRDGLGDAISFQSVAGMQKAEMWQCVEHRKTTGSGKTRRTEVYYTSEWVDHPVSFLGRGGGCNGLGINPRWPENVRTQTVEESANTVRAGSFTLQRSLIRGGEGAGLSPDTSRPLPLQDFQRNFPTPYEGLRSPPSGGYSSLTLGDLSVDPSGAALVTCKGSPAYGCMRLRYFRDWSTVASAITTMQAGGNTAPMVTPASWGCDKGEFEALYPGQMTEKELVDALHTSNEIVTWVLRVAGVLAAWLAVFLFLQPVAAAADIIGDCLNFIPCVGGLLESMVEGIVESVLCLISCGFGCSCALCVMGIVWLAMRPLYGGILLGACVLFCGCACAIGCMHKPARAHSRHVKQEDDAESD